MSESAPETAEPDAQVIDEELPPEPGTETDVAMEFEPGEDAPADAGDPPDDDQDQGDNEEQEVEEDDA